MFLGVWGTLVGVSVGVVVGVSVGVSVAVAVGVGVAVSVGVAVGGSMNVSANTLPLYDGCCVLLKRIHRLVTISPPKPAVALLNSNCPGFVGSTHK